jgi:DNA-directed RNA polymerase specialized sigma24 family protein
VVDADASKGTDSELLAATVAGEEAAFVELYTRHKDRVFRFAYCMTGSIDVAREVTQSCFVALLETPSRYDTRRANLGTYLCAAARHMSLRHASRAWRERPLLDDSEREMRVFQSEAVLFLREGETLTLASTVDPQSGEAVEAELTLERVK